MTRLPARIQRRRTAGWRMPPGALYVGRPSRWGNPFFVVPTLGGWSVHMHGGTFAHWHATRLLALKSAVTHYRRWLGQSIARSENLVPLLAGRDLACWCPLDQPCHADALLEIANGSST